MRVHSSSVACGHGVSTFRLGEQGECGPFDRNQVRLSTVVQKLRCVATVTPHSSACAPLQTMLHRVSAAAARDVATRSVLRLHVHTSTADAASTR